MATKGKAIGPFVTVAVKNSKKGKDVFVLMRKATADIFKIPAADNTITTKKGYKVKVRGSRGAGSMKVQVKQGDKLNYRRVPIPAGVTNEDVEAWVKTWGVPPKSFVSKNGRTYYVASDKKA